MKLSAMHSHNTDEMRHEIVFSFHGDLCGSMGREYTNDMSILEERIFLLRDDCIRSFHFLLFEIIKQPIRCPYTWKTILDMVHQGKRDEIFSFFETLHVKAWREQYDHEPPLTEEGWLSHIFENVSDRGVWFIVAWLIPIENT